MPSEREVGLVELIERERARLASFIRGRVPDLGDAEDILQEVFVELIEANRLLMPIDHLTAWLFRVARNRIVDLFRRRRVRGEVEPPATGDDALGWDDLLPSAAAGPEAVALRSERIAELERALAELPAEQRAVFLAHEVAGQSFQEIARETGVNVNTLLARKRYAVLKLRERLRRDDGQRRDLQGDSK